MTLRHLRNEFTVARLLECADVRTVFRRVDPDRGCRPQSQTLAAMVSDDAAPNLVPVGLLAMQGG